ncbi:MAG: periplasmic heavy metal sensor [Elusimicrobia bacterium]|nr:periplasmic heavy metal sensor [Elusimicrobiota bacterium]
MTIRWNQVAVAAAAGFLLGAVFSDFYRMHRMPWPPPPHHMDGPMEMFNHELGLTESQREKVSAIFKKYQPEMEKIMEENRPKMEEVRLRIKSELKAVLTPEQAAKLEELEKDFRPEGHHGPPMRRGHGGF